MTVNDIFNALPSRFNPAAATGITKTLQWNISGEEAGVWAFQIIDGAGQLIPGGVEKPDVTFIASDKDWVAIATGKLEAMRAFMTGKLKITGDMSLATKMSQFFPLENA